MSSSGISTGLSVLAIIWRAVAFLALWLILAGGRDPSDRPAIVIALVAATWASLRLLPPGKARISPIAFARFVLRFLHQSIVAGTDVAWRALDPRLPLRPGFVVYPPHLPPGPALDAFCALTSLAPGTLPAGADDSGAIVVHCLDVGQPVASHLAADEELFTRARWGTGATMAEFLLASSGFVLAMVAVGLIRVLHGPANADRMMATQLFGTGGIAVLLLMAVATDVTALVDVALVMALLAAFAAVAFVIGGARSDAPEPGMAERS